MLEKPTDLIKFSVPSFLSPPISLEEKIEIQSVSQFHFRAFMEQTVEVFTQHISFTIIKKKILIEKPDNTVKEKKKPF